MISKQIIIDYLKDKFDYIKNDNTFQIIEISYIAHDNQFEITGSREVDVYVMGELKTHETLVYFTVDSNKLDEYIKDINTKSSSEIWDAHKSFTSST